MSAIVARGQQMLAIDCDCVMNPWFYNVGTGLSGAGDRENSSARQRRGLYLLVKRIKLQSRVDRETQ